MSDELIRRTWNRACFGRSEGMQAGDEALAAVLAFHGSAMNGGVPDAVECVPDESLRAAIDNCRDFGLGDVATFIAEAKRVISAGQDLSHVERQFNETYKSQASDSAIDRAFELDYAAYPQNDAPIG